MFATVTYENGNRSWWTKSIGGNKEKVDEVQLDVKMGCGRGWRLHGECCVVVGGIAWCVVVCTTTVSFSVLAFAVRKYPRYTIAKGTKNMGIIQIMSMFRIKNKVSEPLRL